MTNRTPVIPLYVWSSVNRDLEGIFVEPCLSIGMLFAYARSVDGGRVNTSYDLHYVGPNATQDLEAWEHHPVPAIFTFSDYIWNVDAHLELGARVKEISPESVCIHGGPSAPKYEEDAARFLLDNVGVDIVVRGEGEHTFVDLLTALDGTTGAAGLELARGVAGSTVQVGSTGAGIVWAPDRPRPTDLDEFPSPYLTGEFDRLLKVPWNSASIETNRGCPYGCTFCDWGSATLARVRKFDLQRVLDELDWIMEHTSPPVLIMNDANFGIFKRDVDITKHIANLASEYGLHTFVISGLAKNTTKYTKQIIETMVEAGIAPLASSLAIQTVDEQTLKIVRRQNIKLDRYDELAEEFAQVGLPVQTDLMVGLPGSSVESFLADLQHCFDRDISARMFLVRMLPNSPMNEPSYRAEHELVVDEHGILVGSSTYTRDDFDRMRTLRVLYRGVDHFGVLRHVLRVVQWDHGIAMSQVLDEIERATREEPERYPLLTFFAHLFDLYTIEPVGWPPFFDEVIDLLEDRLGLQRDSGVDAAITAQIAVLPAQGRTFPDKVELAHDMKAYVEAKRVTDGTHRRLVDFGPATLEVDDPTYVRARMLRNDFPERRDMESGNLYWIGYDWEMESPLARSLHSNVRLREPVS